MLLPAALSPLGMTKECSEGSGRVIGRFPCFQLAASLIYFLLDAPAEAGGGAAGVDENDREGVTILLL